MSNPLVYIACLPLVLLLVYLLVRVGAAAFFKSKHQFDSTANEPRRARTFP